MSRNIVIIVITGIIFILLHAVAGFLPIEYFWGVDQWTYFSPYLIVLFTLTGLCLCILPALKPLPFKKVNLDIFSNRVYYAIVPVFSFFPLWYLRQKLFFLGDGFLWLRSLEAGTKIRVEKPLEIYFHHLFYEFTKKNFNLNPEISWALLSVICGMFFILFAMLFANHTGRNTTEKTILFLSIVLTGTIQVFFGYIETYAFITLLILASVYFGLKARDNATFMYASLFTFSLAVCAHNMAVIFSPAFLYLFIVIIKNKKETLLKVFPFLSMSLTVLAPLVLTILIFKNAQYSFGDIINAYKEGKHILPFFVNTTPSFFPYTVFSFHHITDFLNELILIAPVTFFVFFILILNKRTSKISRQLSSPILFVFLILSSIIPVVFSFLYHMELGASRDWDLFSFISLPVTILSILIISSVYKDRLQTAGIIIIGCCLLHTLPWILVNASKNHSLQRFEKLADSKTWSNFARPLAFDELRMYYMGEEDYTNALTWTLKAYTINKNRRFAINLASVYFELGRESFEQKKYQEAGNYLHKAYEYYPDSFDINQSLGVLYALLKEYEKAIYHYKKALQIKPDDIFLLRDLSVLSVLTGNPDEAQIYIDKALELNKDEELNRQLLNLKRELDRLKK